MGIEAVINCLYALSSKLSLGLGYCGAALTFFGALGAFGCLLLNGTLASLTESVIVPYLGSLLELQLGVGSGRSLDDC